MLDLPLRLLYQPRARIFAVSELRCCRHDLLIALLMTAIFPRRFGSRRFRARASRAPVKARRRYYAPPLAFITPRRAMFMRYEYQQTYAATLQRK